jgi:hypothetical protein
MVGREALPVDLTVTGASGIIMAFALGSAQ